MRQFFFVLFVMFSGSSCSVDDTLHLVPRNDSLQMCHLFPKKKYIIIIFKFSVS